MTAGNLRIFVDVASNKPKAEVRHRELLEMHGCSRSGNHELTSDARVADLIVLVGDFESLVEAESHPLLRLYPEKTMMYSEIDALVAGIRKVQEFFA